MIHISNRAFIETMIDPLAKCFDHEAARRVAKLKVTPQVKARIDYLGGLAKKNKLTFEEEAEYSNLMRYRMFVTVLKSKARLQLASERASRRKPWLNA